MIHDRNHDTIRTYQRRQPLPPATEGTRLRLDLKGLPAGAYFVTLVTPQGSHTEKLFVK